MGGKFEVYQDGKGEFRFRLKAGRKNAGDATVVDQTA